MNLLIVGFGAHGKEYCDQYFYLGKNDFHLKYLITSKSDVKDQLLENHFCYELPMIYKSLDDFLSENKKDVDFIIISTPPASHFDIFKKLLYRFPHAYFMIDKPCFMNAVEYDEINEYSKGQFCGIADRLIINLPRRRFSLYQNLKEKLIEGSLGSPRCISFEWTYSFPRIFKGFGFYGDPNPKTSFRATDSGEHGGALFDFGSHILDLLTWLLDAKIIDIQGYYRKDDSKTNTSCVMNVKLENSILVSGSIMGSPLIHETDFKLNIVTDICRIFIDNDASVCVSYLDITESFVDNKKDNLYLYIDDIVKQGKLNYCCLDDYKNIFEFLSLFLRNDCIC